MVWDLAGTCGGVAVLERLRSLEAQVCVVNAIRKSRDDALGTLLVSVKVPIIYATSIVWKREVQHLTNFCHVPVLRVSLRCMEAVYMS